MKIVWTNEAQDQLGDIRDYIARDSVKNANAFVKKLVAAPKRLIVHPNSGRMIPELEDPDKREVIFGNFRIMYYVDGNIVHITQVQHGARMFP